MLGVCFCISILVIAFLSPVYRTNSPAATQVSSTDFIAVLLTALGVMIAVLTITIAIVALMGWKDLREAAEKKGKEVSEQWISEYLPRAVKDEDGDIRAILSELVREEVKRQSDPEAERYRGIQAVGRHDEI